MKHIAKQIHDAILHADRILLVPHKNPDGDAMGAVSGLADWLESIKKNYLIFCATDVSKQLSYLNPKNKLIVDTAIWDKPFDVIVVCDSGDLRYAGVDELMKKQPDTTIINIDHHITNEHYGALNLVVTHASSTSEIVYRFLTLCRAAISADMATSLLTGIITDTDNFTNSATSAGAIEAASELVGKGARFDTIKHFIYKNTPLTAFQLWGRIFSRLTKHESLGIVYTYLKQSDLQEFNLAEDDISGVTNFLNAIDDGHAGMILKEQTDGSVKGSFRTTRDDVDVSHMAKHFGGGGHKKAAGFAVDGPMEQALEHILSELEILFSERSILHNT